MLTWLSDGRGVVIRYPARTRNFPAKRSDGQLWPTPELKPWLPRITTQLSVLSCTAPLHLWFLLKVQRYLLIEFSVRLGKAKTLCKFGYGIRQCKTRLKRKHVTWDSRHDVTCFRVRPSVPINLKAPPYSTHLPPTQSAAQVPNSLSEWHSQSSAFCLSVSAEVAEKVRKKWKRNWTCVWRDGEGADWKQFSFTSV